MSRPERTSRRAPALGILAAAGLAALVAGCGSSKPTNATMTCPRLLTPQGTSSIVIFGPGGHDARDVRIGGSIKTAELTCRREPTGIDVTADIAFFVQRANNTIPDATLPYFVAVVDPNEKVLAQEVFQIKTEFRPGEPDRTIPGERVIAHLPVRDPLAGASFAIAIGFQLTPDQLVYNRSTHPQGTP